MGGVNKGGTGMPQGQAPQGQIPQGAMGNTKGSMGGKGAGGMPQYQQQYQQNQQQANAANTAPAGVGDPRAAGFRYQQMQQRMAGGMGRPDQGFMGGGIGSLANMNGMSKADFMPGGALAAPLELGANPNPGGATPTGVDTAAPPQQQMAMEARDRMRSQMGGIGNMGRGWGRGGFGGGKGGGGYGNMMGQRGQMNNGGIVGLAGGGMLGQPVSRGGVSFAAPVANRPLPVAAAPPASAPRVAWTPEAAAPAGGGSMFTGVNPGAIAAPAKWSGPTTPQEIWQPPAQAAAAAENAGMDPATYRKMQMARMLGIPIKDPKAAMAGMSDRQYIDWKMGGQGKGSGGKGGGGRRSANR